LAQSPLAPLGLRTAVQASTPRARAPRFSSCRALCTQRADVAHADPVAAQCRAGTSATLRVAMPSAWRASMTTRLLTVDLALSPFGGGIWRAADAFVKRARASAQQMAALLIAAVLCELPAAGLPAWLRRWRQK
jgi:hypothetical protein